MIETIITSKIVQANASCEYLLINSLFSHAIYQIANKIIFQIHAQTQVKITNLVKLYLKTQAGIEINCLTAGINLALKVVTQPCFLKKSSAWE